MMRKMKRKMMKIYGQPKLRSFEAFVTKIEISIFGFKNSTLGLTPSQGSVQADIGPFSPPACLRTSPKDHKMLLLHIS